MKINVYNFLNIKKVSEPDENFRQNNLKLSADRSLPTDVFEKQVSFGQILNNQEIIQALIKIMDGKKDNYLALLEKLGLNPTQYKWVLGEERTLNEDQIKMVKQLLENPAMLMKRADNTSVKPASNGNGALKNSENNFLPAKLDIIRKKLGLTLTEESELLGISKSNLLAKNRQANLFYADEIYLYSLISGKPISWFASSNNGMEVKKVLSKEELANLPSAFTIRHYLIDNLIKTRKSKEYSLTKASYVLKIPKSLLIQIEEQKHRFKFHELTSIANGYGVKIDDLLPTLINFTEYEKGKKIAINANIRDLFDLLVTKERIQILNDKNRQCNNLGMLFSFRKKEEISLEEIIKISKLYDFTPQLYYLPAGNNIFKLLGEHGHDYLLGQKFREIKKALKLDNAYLANILEISENHYRDKQRGIYKITADEVYKMSFLSGVPVYSFRSANIDFTINSAFERLHGPIPSSKIILERIGKNLKIAREKSGVHMSTAAQSLGFKSANSIYQIENLQQRVTIEQLMILSKLYKTSFEDLFKNPQFEEKPIPIIGKKIKNIIMAKHLSYDEFGALIKTSSSGITRRVNGKQDFFADEIFLISSWTDMPFDWFLDDNISTEFISNGTTTLATKEKLSTEIIKSRLISNLKKSREFLKLSYKDVSEHTGIDLHTVMDSEKGKHRLKLSELIKLAELYNINYCDLVKTTETFYPELNFKMLNNLYQLSSPKISAYELYKHAIDYNKPLSHFKQFYSKDVEVSDNIFGYSFTFNKILNETDLINRLNRNFVNSRKNRGLSQSQAAKQLQISKASIQRREISNCITAADIFKFANLYGIEPEKLLFEDIKPMQTGVASA